MISYLEIKLRNDKLLRNKISMFMESSRLNTIKMSFLSKFVYKFNSSKTPNKIFQNFKLILKDLWNKKNL